MARDLIPPPSPAGRPDPDQPGPLSAVAGDDPSPPPPLETSAALAPGIASPFRGRFGFVLGGLLGCGVAAAVLLVALLTQSDDPGAGLARNWSRWHPVSSEPNAGAVEIAEHVGRQYRMANGKQLVAVTGGPLAIQDVPLSVALRPPGGTIQLLDGRGVLYTLNGLGPRGSILEGKPSKARHLLLRREALELALYSFRYLDDVTMVVTLLPPAPPTQADANGGGSGQGANGTKSQQTREQPRTQALFYRPGDLRPQLEVPLGVTMSARTPRPETFAGEEARRIDSLTLSNLFLASVQQAQDTKAYLVLDRPS